MIVSGMSGNEIYCLSLKGFSPSELVVGNSVCSLGVVGGLGAWGTGITGGEVTAVTQMIAEGRHAAITRMAKEAEKHGAVGVTSVMSEVRSLAGYMEFLSQGTAIIGEPPLPAGAPGTSQTPAGGHPGGVFTTAASGMELYCHLDAGYRPMRFAMGNVAYALGLGQGIAGSVRTMARGEVKEFSQMYNHIRHLALERLRKEAKEAGANAVVDVKVRMLPFGPTTTELLMTGTASHHAGLSGEVITSELTGEELWNLAKMGYVPVQLVMATSVYSLGVMGGIGTLFKGMTKGELPELTSLIYQARENCIELLGQEAEKFGAERVVGNKLTIRELGPGLIEVMALGTAVRKLAGAEPESAVLIPQAIIFEKDSLENDPMFRSESNVAAAALTNANRARVGASNIVGLAVGLFITFAMACGGFVIAMMSAASHHP